MEARDTSSDAWNPLTPISDVSDQVRGRAPVVMTPREWFDTYSGGRAIITLYYCIPLQMQPMEPVPAYFICTPTRTVSLCVWRCVYSDLREPSKGTIV